MSQPHLPHRGMLLLPRIRVQNANAISSPLTWGFPAITAFTGLMTALERRLGPQAGINLLGVGVVCHGFEAQVTTDGYTRAFRLTRNPVLQDGSTAAIVEEGRVHLDISLVFEVRLGDALLGDAEREALAGHIAQTLGSMRLAGGSVMPPLPSSPRRPQRALLALVPDDPQEQREQFRRLARRLMPGFALISRDDLLQQRLAELRTHDARAGTLDAWLDLARWTSRAVAAPTADAQAGDTPDDHAAWVTDPRPGWIVPIPVGFTALSPLLPAGSVANARDMVTPFRFVETVWSIGQWISPHRLQRLSELIWQSGHDHDPAQPSDQGLYRCFIDPQATAATPY
ncbi:type I-F CRISPR-associated protein Csy2 [Ideonella sp. B7]|uniref:type I-F CRISPR-associated protein Csy2 n=1 Tax=Ideonella benzenivorans TaxID=2831643 RepID=UPI001CECA6A8|nr:type I-F CRISPR-associated protein Csy2 [Ideonella benzenivorans]MCA6215896.1 type I-F CRISPR-associated protein Csy2 [Ideonella benzenivorans]